MMDRSKIKEHMEVVGSDGAHVGTVDNLHGDLIKLTKNDPESEGEHHYLSVDHVAAVDSTVQLSLTAAEAKASFDAS